VHNSKSKKLLITDAKEIAQKNVMANANLGGYEKARTKLDFGHSHNIKTPFFRFIPWSLYQFSQFSSQNFEPFHVSLAIIMCFSFQ
jgi:hypothetical protein